MQERWPFGLELLVWFLSVLLGSAIGIGLVWLWDNLLWR